MRSKLITLIFAVAVQLCVSPASAQTQTEQALHYQDIHKVMQQILAQHVSQKQITAKTIKGAFKVYIDKFDPERVYLLESEVNPYFNLSNLQAEEILQQYNQDQYPEFTKLNSLLQKAITRSRTLRHAIESQPVALFTMNLKRNSEQEEQWNDPDLKKPFAKDTTELKNRFQQYIIEFINAEKRRYGNSAVMEHQQQTLAIFEDNLQAIENPYLYQHEDGTTFSKEEQENFFVMHILKSLASSLDAHTSFYSGAEAYDLRVKLEKEFPGIGIGFQQNQDGKIIVHDMSSDGPAAKSGQIKINDTLLAIDGKSVKEMAFDKVMEMVRGNVGTSLTLTLQHEGSNLPIQIPLKMQEITVNEDRVDMAYEKFDDSIIGIITLHSFYQGENGVTSENDVRAALIKLKKTGNLRGLILDLRENSGGFLGQAVKVAGLFISNGVVVISKYFNGDEHYYRDVDGKTYYDGPLIILTSRATASAAEIVAQALQDYGIAIVVGDETTYGKGTIQNQTVTETEGENKPLFKVTVGKYYTVSGKTPQINGVKADVIVPGVFNYEHIGERYLEYTVPNDTIPDEFNDDLADVSTPQLKAWFLRYYLPTLQKKREFWQRTIPLLQQNSQNRLTHNGDYQRFLDEMRAGRPTTFFTRNKNGKPVPVDFQLNEAVAISKDMIQLEVEERNKTIAGPNKSK